MLTDEQIDKYVRESLHAECKETEAMLEARITRLKLENDIMYDAFMAIIGDTPPQNKSGEWFVAKDVVASVKRIRGL